jgi:hypothetical protein
MSNQGLDTVDTTADAGRQIPQQDPLTGEYAGDSDELDEWDQQIADLGPAPGYGSSAAESDRYNFAVAEIEADRAAALAELPPSEGGTVPSEDTSGERPDVIILDPPDYDEVAANNKEGSAASGDDGAMGAATPTRSVGTGSGTTSRTSSGSDSGGVVAVSFDPGSHTVAEVEAYIDAHPDEEDAVLDAERAGKNRASLVG